MREEEQIRERYELTLERIRMIPTEESVISVYRDYFQKTAEFILKVDAILNRVSSKTLDSWVAEEDYDTSYANPEFAVQTMGEDIGRYLCALYAEIQNGIEDASRSKIDYLTIRNELFVEIYNCFEEENEPNIKELRNILYWYVSDYYEVFVTDRIKEMFLGEATSKDSQYHLFLGGSVFLGNACKALLSERFVADHAEDIALILDKKLLERKLEVVRNTLEQTKDTVVKYEGTIPFAEEKTVNVEPSVQAIRFTEKQISLNEFYSEKEKQIISQYLAI